MASTEGEISLYINVNSLEDGLGRGPKAANSSQNQIVTGKLPGWGNESEGAYRD